MAREYRVSFMPFTSQENEAVRQVSAKLEVDGVAARQAQGSSANLLAALEADADEARRGERRFEERVGGEPQTPRGNSTDTASGPTQSTAGPAAGGGALTSPYNANRAAITSSVAKTSKDKADANILKKAALRVINRHAE